MTERNTDISAAQKASKARFAATIHRVCSACLAASRTDFPVIGLCWRFCIEPGKACAAQTSENPAKRHPARLANLQAPHKHRSIDKEGGFNWLLFFGRLLALLAEPSSISHCMLTSTNVEV